MLADQEGAQGKDQPRTSAETADFQSPTRGRRAGPGILSLFWDCFSFLVYKRTVGSGWDAWEKPEGPYQDCSRKTLLMRSTGKLLQ